MKPENTTCLHWNRSICFVATRPLFIYIILYLNMNRESNIGFKKPWLGLIKSGMFGESHSYQQDMQPCCIQFLIIFTCNNKKKLE